MNKTLDKVIITLALSNVTEIVILGSKLSEELEVII